jgi:hypothetical protein
MIDIHIYACDKRRENAEKLAKQLNAEIHWDKSDLPTPYERYIINCKSAWLAPMPKRLTHRIVLADDAGACEGFKEIAAKCARAYPKAIWSFVSQGDMDDAPYQIMCSHFPMGVAMMIPVEYIHEIFDPWEAKPGDADDPKKWGLNTDETIVERYVMRHRGDIHLMTTNPNIAAHLAVGGSELQPGKPNVYASKTFTERPDQKRWDDIRTGVTI